MSVGPLRHLFSPVQHLESGSPETKARKEVRWAVVESARTKLRLEPLRRAENKTQKISQGIQGILQRWSQDKNIGHCGLSVNNLQSIKTVTFYVPFSLEHDRFRPVHPN